MRVLAGRDRPITGRRRAGCRLGEGRPTTMRDAGRMAGETGDGGSRRVSRRLDGAGANMAARGGTVVVSEATTQTAGALAPSKDAFPGCEHRILCDCYQCIACKIEEI
ncbi:hypothetical protein DA2_1032 [Desulfovibrio sp. A2]|nr:hypothetical protein DA2_1032 [Desulfovibrio sp. A2]